MKPNSSKNIVFDSSAIIHFFEGTLKGKIIPDILSKTEKMGGEKLISVINWGELLYVTEKLYGKEQCLHVEKSINEMNISIIPIEQAITRKAIFFKSYYKMAYADCFAAALAEMKQATLITSDQDFQRIKSHVQIHFV